MNLTVFSDMRITVFSPSIALLLSFNLLKNKQMKKFTITFAIILAASFISFSEAQTQNDNTEHEGLKFENASQIITNVNQGLSSAEERKINVVIEDHNPE